MKLVVPIVTLLLLTFFSFKIISLSHKKQQAQYELAELNSIKYGLFDVDEWKDRIAEIIVKKIDEYEISSENKEYVKGQIEIGFYKLLDELSNFLEQNKKVGNWFERLIKGVTYDIAFDKEAFKTQVPLWADQVMKLIEDPENQTNLKDHLKARIVKLIDESKSYNERTILNSILLKYNFNANQLNECRTFLNNEITDFTKQLTLFSIIFIFFSLLPFLIPVFYEVENIIIIKVLVLIFLLIIGISIPMLSIDIRIDDFKFKLLGEEVIFVDQSMYFQTKSILHLIKILFTTATFKSILTGFLILLFSVVFPFTKLFSILYESYKNNKTEFTDFFISKAGKWSTADVMVVAIFLAFLGINSFLNELLSLSESTKEYLTVIPNNNHSSLEVGIVFFIGYVVLSLLTAPVPITREKMRFGETF